MVATKRTLTNDHPSQSDPWQRSTTNPHSHRAKKPHVAQMRIVNPADRSLMPIKLNLDEPTQAWLIQEHQSLLRSNQELELFAACAAHELKSPLNAALGWLRSLQNQLTKASETNLTQTFEIIERNLTKSIHQVNDILSLAKLNPQTENHTLCRMNQLLDDVLQNHAEKIQKHNVIVSRTSLPDIAGNVNQLESVVSNLIDNSIKYKDAKRQLEIKIGYTAREKQHEFSIQDNGKGIPISELENIFNLFSTVTTQPQLDSTGIGLAYCRKIITLHDGHIWAESNLHHGVTIKFSLPK